MAIKLKTIKVGDKTYAEFVDDKPIYVDDDGKEIQFDAPHALGKITELQAENKKYREAGEAATAKLKAFGELDPAAAAKALETVANLDAGQLVTAGKVEEIKKAAQTAAEAQVSEVRKKAEADIAALSENNKKLSSMFSTEKIGSLFGRSKFISDKLILPPDTVMKIFGSNFKVDENGNVLGYRTAGDEIFSRKKAGDKADFDESLEILIDEYPFKDSLIKAAGGGGGSKGNNGTNGAGGKTMTRKAYEALPLAERAAALKGTTLVDE